MVSNQVFQNGNQANLISVALAEKSLLRIADRKGGVTLHLSSEQLLFASIKVSLKISHIIANL